MTTGYYTTEKLGPKRSKTPEGFLLVCDAPLARTGVMFYAPGDLDPDITAGPDGVIKVLRDPEEVFSENTIASANGKPIANDHPEENGEKVFITTDNWRKFAAGTVLNPRRGTGSFSDILLGDILVTDPEVIADIDAGKRELSASYDSLYIPTQQPGVWRQTQIIMNHVALVDRGRCGPRCAISDSATSAKTSRSSDMANTKNVWARIAENIRKAAKTNDAAGLENALKAGEMIMPDGGGPTGDDAMGGGDGSETHVHVHMPASASGAAPGGTEGHGGGSKPGAAGGAGEKVFDDETEARFKKLEDGHTAILSKLEEIGGKLNGAAPAAAADAEEKQSREEIKEEVGEKASKAADSAPLHETFQAVVSAAEIIHPGIQVPAFDPKEKPMKTYDAICGLRRKALEVAAATADTAPIVREVLGKPMDLAAMSCGDVRSTFNSVAAVKRASARSAAADAAARERNKTTTQNPGEIVGRPMNTRELADFLDKKYGRAA